MKVTEKITGRAKGRQGDKPRREWVGYIGAIIPRYMGAATE